jgi:hypothetical protein
MIITLLNQHTTKINMEDLDRLEKLKRNSIENPGKRKRGCHNCKKKDVEVKAEPLLITEDMWIPTQEEIKLAYAELTSFGGVKEDKKELIANVYRFIFDEDFDFNCKSCVSKQARRFNYYLNGQP